MARSGFIIHIKLGKVAQTFSSSLTERMKMLAALLNDASVTNVCQRVTRLPFQSMQELFHEVQAVHPAAATLLENV